MMGRKIVLFTVMIMVLAGLTALAQSPVELLSVIFQSNESAGKYVRDNRIYNEGWSNLPQVAFWKQVVLLSPDSGLLNVGSTRSIEARLSVAQWNLLGDVQKEELRAKIRLAKGLAADEKIFFTRGKNDFYDFDNALQVIGKAFDIFEAQGVPAFYAQSILLIECPGKLKKSSAGAAGHFQLMPGVATSMGLKVNKYVDERRDFEKCTRAAAKFIQTVCIPNADRVLNERSIAYNHDDLWYKMLVLHVYHAGSGNVAKAIDALPIKPISGSLDMITTLWKTKAGAFGNASQNYSQIALANTVLLYDLLELRCFNLECNPYIATNTQ